MATRPTFPRHVQCFINLFYRHSDHHVLVALDLTRLVIAYAPESYANGSELTSRFFAALFDGAEWADPWSPLPLPKFRETNILLLLRALANAFKDDTTVGDGAWIKLVCLFPIFMFD